MLRGSLHGQLVPDK